MSVSHKLNRRNTRNQQRTPLDLDTQQDIPSQSEMAHEDSPPPEGATTPKEVDKGDDTNQKDETKKDDEKLEVIQINDPLIALEEIERITGLAVFSEGLASHDANQLMKATGHLRTFFKQGFRLAFTDTNITNTHQHLTTLKKTGFQKRTPR